MAKAEPVVEVEASPVVPIQSRSRLLILLAFSAVVLLEMIVLLFFLPKPSVPPMVGGQENSPVILSVDPLPEHKSADWLEFPIADPFNSMVTSNEGTGSGYMVTAKFTLKHEKSKSTKFSNLYDKNKDTIRGEIITILCSSKIEDFSDPNRTVIRNKILRKINEIFAEPQPLVKEVIVVSFLYTPM